MGESESRARRLQPLPCKEASTVTDQFSPRTPTGLKPASPFSRVADVAQAQIAKRQTAAGYLQALTAKGFLQVQEHGREKLYLNHRLIDLLKNESAEGDAA